MHHQHKNRKELGNRREKTDYEILVSTVYNLLPPSSERRPVTTSMFNEKSLCGVNVHTWTPVYVWDGVWQTFTDCFSSAVVSVCASTGVVLFQLMCSSGEMWKVLRVPCSALFWTRWSLSCSSADLLQTKVAREGCSVHFHFATQDLKTLLIKSTGHIQCPSASFSCRESFHTAGTWTIKFIFNIFNKLCWCSCHCWRLSSLPAFRIKQVQIKFSGLLLVI